MDWTQTFSIIATIISAAVYIHMDVKTLRQDFQNQSQVQSARTDDLYKEFISLVREVKK